MAGTLTSTPSVVALIEGRAADLAIVRMAAGSAELNRAALRVVAVTPRIARTQVIRGLRIEPWKLMEQRERFLVAHVRDLLLQLKVNGAHVEVRFGRRLAAAATLAADGGARLIVAAPRPAFLHGWSPGDRLLARRLGGRLVWIDQQLPEAEDASHPDAYRILRQHALYAQVPASDVRHAAHGLDLVRLGPHELLMEEGRPNSAFWLILDGAVAVSAGGKRVRVAGRGGFVGGFSLLTGKPAAASVVTLTPVRALVASERGFSQVAGHELVRIRLRDFYAVR